MQWYYSANNQQQGPVSEEQLKQLASTGVINDQSLVWREGMPDWQPYGSVVGGVTRIPLGGTGAGAGATGAAGGSAAVCPTCGDRTDSNTLIPIGDTVVCPSCRDNYSQRLKEGGRSEGVGKPEGTGGQTPVFTLISEARSSLSGHWWPSIGFLFVFGILTGFLNLITSLIPYLGVIIQWFYTGQFTYGLAANMLSVSRGGGTDFGNLFVGFQDYGRILGVYLLSALIVVVPVIMVGIIAAMAVGAMSAANPDGFNPETMGAGLIVGVVLFGLFLILALVYLQLKFSMIYYILHDFPEFGVIETLKYSWAMTNGLILKIFWFGIVFGFIMLVVLIGLGLMVFAFSLMGEAMIFVGGGLAVLALFAFMLWYGPLYMVAFARLYDDI